MNVQSLKSDPGVTPGAFDGNAALLNEIRRYINQNSPPWRFDTVGASMEWTYGAPILQIPSAAGISPMALENAIQLRLFLHDGYRWGWNYPLEKLDSPVLDLMNVRYVITGAKEAPRVAALSKFRHIATLPGIELFENTGVFPRIFVVHHVRTAASLDKARALILQHQVDLRESAIAEDPIRLSSDRGDAHGSDEVKTLRHEPRTIEVSTQSASGGLLIFSETYYPGWKAWLDDEPTSIHSTDIALRGVIVPAGTHRVRMEFRPAILSISLAISLVTAILLGISIILYRSNARRIQL